MQIKSVHRAVLALALLAAGSAAQAICPVTTAWYGGGTYGTEAEALDGGCFRTVAGGAGVASAAQSSTAMTASANLGTAVLTSYSAGGSSSSALWDTVTFSGIAPTGALVTESLSLTGSMTTDADGYAWVSVGTGVGQDYDSFGSDSMLMTNATGVPASVSTSFYAYNGETVLVLAELETHAYQGGIADLSDPPTFHLIVPEGVTYTSASGVLGLTSSVPEPGSLVLMAAGLALLGAARASSREVTPLLPGPHRSRSRSLRAFSLAQHRSVSARPGRS